MKKNILFVVDNLVMGGVTRVLINLLNLLDYSKYNIDLLVLHNHDTMQISIPPNVGIINGNKFYDVMDEPIKKLINSKKIGKIIKKFFFAFLIKTGLMKSVLKKHRNKFHKKVYDIEIGFCDGFSHLYVSVGKAPLKIAWLHSDVKVKNYSSRYTNILINALKKIDYAIAVSKKVGEAYKEIYKIKDYIVIPNTINTKEIISKSCEFNPFNNIDNSKIIVSVGRLDYSKNYEMLINIHKKLIESGSNIKTYIVGEGHERKKLETLVKKLNVEDSLYLVGEKQNPYPYIKNADLFALTSRYEGLPTVILEALILKTPCISTNVAGVNSLLKENYGYIANNFNDFYEKIHDIIENKNLLGIYKSNLVYYFYDNNSIIKQIETIFDL